MLYSISTYLRSPERLKLFELSCLWNRKLSLQFCNHLLYFKHSFWTDKLIQFLAYYAHELWVLLSVICNLTKNNSAKISLHLYICQLKYTWKYMSVSWTMTTWKAKKCASHNQGRKNNGKQSLCGFSPSKTFKYFHT